jgi:hypothetical protein
MAINSVGFLKGLEYAKKCQTFILPTIEIIQKDAKMARLLKVVLMCGLIAVSVGCGQKGPLYMPSQQVTQEAGL